MENEVAASVERVLRFLAATEQCRRSYLPLIAGGSGWALALLLAAALVLAPQLEEHQAGGIAALVAAIGYLTVTRVVFPRRGPGSRGATGKRTLTAAALLALLVLLPSIPPGLKDKLLLLLLAAPSGRRLALYRRSLGAAVMAPASLLAAALVMLAIYASMHLYLNLLAASELLVVAIATGRMITCSDEAISKLLGESVVEE